MTVQLLTGTPQAQASAGGGTPRGGSRPRGGGKQQNTSGGYVWVTRYISQGVYTSIVKDLFQHFKTGTFFQRYKTIGCKSNPNVPGEILYGLCCQFIVHILVDCCYVYLTSL